MKTTQAVQPLRIADAARAIRHVFVRDLVLDAHIGVHRHEEGRAQPIRVNIDLTVAETAAPVDDLLANVVDYEHVINGVREIVAAGHVRLVETLAEAVASFALRDLRDFLPGHFGYAWTRAFAPTIDWNDIVLGAFSSVAQTVLFLPQVVALVVVAMNIGEVPAMIGHIVGHALGFEQITGAAFGAALMQGMRRGLFSNEAGMGSVPNAAATAEVSHPVKQGLVQALGVYFDTIIVCSATAFIILLTQPKYGVSDPEGIGLTQTALQAQVGSWAGPFLSIVIFFLAWSSILGNSYYGEANIRFLTESKPGEGLLTAFRVGVLVCVVGGALGSVALVWNLADLAMGIMATINLLALLPLGGLSVALLKDFLTQRAAGKDPVFERSSLPQAKNVQLWDAPPARSATPE